MTGDWAALAASAREQGLDLHFYWRIKDDPDVPAEVLAPLRREFEANTMRNLGLSGALAAILGALDKAAVPAICFKGLMLAWEAYGNLGRRRFTDLDIMVRPGQLGAAIAVLQQLGYVLKPGGDWLEPEVMARWRAEITLIHPATGVMVDLHWKLGARHYPFRMSEDGVWARSRIVRPFGFAVRVMSPADQLLYLAKHGLQHNWDTLDMVVDFARLLDRSGVEWQALLDRARAEGLVRPLLVALELARVRAELQLPGFVQELIAADARVNNAVARVLRSYSLGRPPTGVEYAALPWSLAGNGVRRLYYMAVKLFAPHDDDWAALRLPEPLFPLYSPLRLFHVVRKLASESLR